MIYVNDTADVQPYVKHNVWYAQICHRHSEDIIFNIFYPITFSIFCQI